MSETFEQAIERCLMDGTTAKALRVMADDFDDRLDFIETGALQQGAEGLDTLVARVTDLSASLNRASDACASVQKERDELREMLGEAAHEIRALQRGYIGTLEHARDRIVTLGGECDPLERMEAYDPHLIASRAFLSRYEGEVK